MSCINLNEDITLTIAAGDSLPLVELFGASLHWLLDVGATAVPEERTSFSRLRRCVDRLGAQRGARIATRDLKIAIAAVLEAIERDLGAAPSRPRVAHPRADRSSRPYSPPNRLAANAQWGIALATGDWIPLFEHHRRFFEWLLDVAHGTTSERTGARQRDAIDRVRAAIRRLDDGALFVDLADLWCVATLVLVALERDLGPVASRPRGRFCMPSATEAFGAALAELVRAAGRNAGKAVAS